MGKVLVVDDDPICRSLIGNHLGRLEATCVEANDGEEAWRELSRQPFDLAIVDLNMPNIDGFELISCIRGFPRTRHLPVVVITSRTDSPAIERALEAGATSFLTKPISWATFKAHLEYLLRLTGETRRLRGALAQAAAVSKAKEHVVASLCTDVASSVDRVSVALRQASLRAVGDGLLAKSNKIEDALADVQALGGAARSALQIIDELHNDIGISDDAASIQGVIEDACTGLEKMAGDAGVALVISPSAVEITVSCRREAIILALHHLIRNAIAHSPTGASVKISATPFLDGLVAIEISDDGIGMSPEFVAQMSVPRSGLETAVRGRVGRGWPVAKAIAEAHNGKLEIHSMPGKGTSALFVIPHERTLSVEPASGGLRSGASG
jgi:CheY-like chemotaxis protein